MSCFRVVYLCNPIYFSEFSESLRELGACLLEKTALNNDDEESGKSRENIIN